MHEMSLMEGILQRAEAALAEYQVKKVNSITVKLSPLANIMPDAFAFAFEALTTGTVFDGSQLITQMLPLTAFCDQCQKKFEDTAIPPHCPSCGAVAKEILSGAEVYLASIDFDEEDELQ